jgi:hypothetical protein
MLGTESQQYLSKSLTGLVEDDSEPAGNAGGDVDPSGVPFAALLATTATDSIFAARHALGLKRVTAISPYTEAVDEAEHRFFAEGGIETTAGAHLGIVDGFRLAEPDAEAILDLAARRMGPTIRRADRRVPQFPLPSGYRYAGDAERKAGGYLDTWRGSTCRALVLKFAADRVGASHLCQKGV